MTTTTTTTTAVAAAEAFDGDTGTGGESAAATKTSATAAAAASSSQQYQSKRKQDQMVQQHQHLELRPFVGPTVACTDKNDDDEDGAVFDSDFTANLPLQATNKLRRLSAATELSSAGNTSTSGSGGVGGGSGSGDSHCGTATNGSTEETDTTIILLPPIPTSSYEMYKWIETTFKDTTETAIKGDMTRFMLFSRRIQVLVGWAKTEDPMIFHYFRLGGLVEKILDFVHANEHNPNVLKDPLELLIICTHHFDQKSETSGTTRETTTEVKESKPAPTPSADVYPLTSTVSSMQEAVITFNGIPILLSAVRYLMDDNCNDENRPIDDEAIQQFWRILWNIVANRSAVKTQLGVAGQVSLVQFAFMWIEKLPDQCVMTARLIPYVLSNLLIIAVAMGTPATKPTDEKDASSPSSLSIFSIRNIAHCITIISDRKPTWLDDPNIMYGVLNFLRLCLRYHDKIKAQTVLGKQKSHTDDFYGKHIVKLCLQVFEKHRETCPAVVTCSMSILSQIHENLYQISRSDFPPTSSTEVGEVAGPGTGSRGILSILASIAESTVLSDNVKESAFKVLKTIR